VIGTAAVIGYGTLVSFSVLFDRVMMKLALAENKRRASLQRNLVMCWVMCSR